MTAAVSRDCETVEETALLKNVLESMRERQCAAMPVVAGGRVVGLLTLENISEIIMINAAMDHQHRAGRTGDNKSRSGHE